MCVLFSGSSPCVGFCKKISVRSCRKSVLPEMQRFLRCGIRNSSSGFWVRSIAVLQKGSEITPSSYWHAAWDCVLGIFARSEDHTSELQSRFDLVCRLLLEKKKEYSQRTDT